MPAEKAQKTKEKQPIKRVSKPKKSVSLPEQKSGFAVITTGGKQYVVVPGQSYKIEKIIGEHKTGDSVMFDKVLLRDDGKDVSIGFPYIDGAKVMATITNAGRYPKVEVIKYKQKSRYFKKNGHRQHFHEIKIVSI